MPPDLNQDATYFLELQTKTGWGRMLKRFAEWCKPQPGDKALDVGCGPGLFPALLEEAGAQAFGCDIDMGHFASPLHTRLAAADVFHLPFANGYFDLITGANLLFLVAYPQTALLEMKRVLRTGGRICLLNPSELMNRRAAIALADSAGLEGLARETLINYGLRAEKHFNWSAEEIQALFERTGFQIQETITRMGPGLVRFVSGIRSN